jgi:hypothetical protein
MSEDKFRKYLELNYSFKNLKHDDTFKWAVNALEDMDSELGCNSYKIEILENKLKKALGIIKFYAEEHNWDFSCTIWDGDWDYYNKNLVGGKKARQFLKDLDEKE